MSDCPKADTSVLASYTVIYISGIPGMKKGKLVLELTPDAFILDFRIGGGRVPIYHYQITNFELRDRPNPLLPGYRSPFVKPMKSWFEIAFVNKPTGQLLVATFEMSISHLTYKNHQECEKLVTMMNAHSIFDKFKNATSAVLPSEKDIPAQIKQLTELRDSGILTEEEFEAKKAELLRRL